MWGIHGEGEGHKTFSPLLGKDGVEEGGGRTINRSRKRTMNSVLTKAASSGRARVDDVF